MSLYFIKYILMTSSVTAIASLPNSLNFGMPENNFFSLCKHFVQKCKIWFGQTHILGECGGKLKVWLSISPLF